ncbi:MAG: hypothetical protein ABSH41_05700 [Syntrophobacteraceae bacterium]
MNKCEFSTPCIVLIGIGVLFLLWLIGKILGASFFFIAAVVIVFLILLIAYLVIRLHIPTEDAHQFRLIRTTDSD